MQVRLLTLDKSDDSSLRSYCILIPSAINIEILSADILGNLPRLTVQNDAIGLPTAAKNEYR